MFIRSVLNKVKKGNIVYLRCTFRTNHHLVNFTDICLSYQTSNRFAVYRHKKTIVGEITVYFQMQGNARVIMPVTLVHS